MDTKFRQMFHNQLKEFDTVFDPKFPGYNGSFGPIFSRVNMGPVQPPPKETGDSPYTIVKSSWSYKPNMIFLSL